MADHGRLAISTFGRFVGRDGRRLEGCEDWRRKSFRTLIVGMMFLRRKEVAKVLLRLGRLVIGVTLELLIVWASPSTGHAGGTRILSRKRFPSVGRGIGIPGSFPTHHEVHLNCFGVMLRIDSRNALPSGQRGRITVPAKHFFSEILRLPGTGIAKMRPDSLGWPILGLCWPICCLCWGPCSPILRLCWGYVGPSWRHVGPCCGRGWTVGYPPRWFGAMLFSWLHRHSQNFAWKRSSQWPARHPLHFCNAISLKKLNPAGDGHAPDERLKAPTSGLRGSRRRLPRRSEAPGGFPVAEATIQATTSLPLHGMAGFKGCRPVPPTPGNRQPWLMLSSLCWWRLVLGWQVFGNTVWMVVGSLDGWIGCGSQRSQRITWDYRKTPRRQSTAAAKQHGQKGPQERFSDPPWHPPDVKRCAWIHNKNLRSW